MECPSCNRNNVLDAKFCRGCGIKFEEILKCENCEAELASGDSFCSGCGKAVKYSPDPEPVPATKNLTLAAKIASNQRDAEERIERNRINRQAITPPKQEHLSQVEVKMNESDGFRSASTLKRLNLAILSVFLALICFGFLFTVIDLIYWNDFQSGKYVSNADWEANDSARDVLANLSNVASISFIIVFLIWIYRVSSNLKFLGNPTQRFSPLWSLIWWFIPIMFWFKPYQVMKEIHERSDPAVNYSTDPPTRTPKLIWWWGFWVVATIFNISTFRLAENAASSNDLIILDWIILGANLLYLVAGILLWSLIVKITNNQENKTSKVVRD